MTDMTIDAVFFAQTHVLQPGAPFFKLVGNKETLIKAHVLSASGAEALPVEAELSLDGETLRLPLNGPAVLPTGICLEPGKVVHRYEDSFTAMIPAHWIKRGLSVTLHAGDSEHTVEKLEIGPPLVMNMTMFDIHYFDYEDVDYPEGYEEEIFVRRPLTELNIQRLKRILFKELIIPPRGPNPAVRLTSTEEHMTKTGEPFNGKQLAAQQWYAALQNAGGQKQLTAFFISIANVHSGGWAWDYAGMGSLRRFPVLNHELGHVLGVDDLPCEAGYPYIGEMYGINKGNGGYHGGPTWRFDPRIGFVPPTLSDQTDHVGEWKKDPMGGGGIGEEPGEAIAQFSDYSVRKMQDYMERNVAQWNEEKQAYAIWNHWTGAFSDVIKNNGINLPIEPDVEVYSILVQTSAVTEEGNFIYPVIGPYASGIIDTFDPAVKEDRKRARRLPIGSWDISLRIDQGGQTKTFMLPIAWKPDDDPLDIDSLQTRAVNVPVRDGEVTRAELLLTPEANVSGMPSNPRVLYSTHVVGME
ncbi:MAG: hypothetical protein HN919_05415 [Verrucomicrobia bacterium]|jgi:hypothetical protein|nr:hypothetical protein [Verrucomicrobiota bacterium]MBT7065718.1 hypothetical protein [Verrucomicrobiota bacterium]MBT7701990.1 hypothetical protein [Verrucomicrobiota bacterium]